MVAAASSTSVSAHLSWVLAAVIAKATGTPPPSVRTCRLVLVFARSVGLGPVFSPAQRGFVQRTVGRPRSQQSGARAASLTDEA